MIIIVQYETRKNKMSWLEKCAKVKDSLCYLSIKGGITMSLKPEESFSIEAEKHQAQGEPGSHWLPGYFE